MINVPCPNRDENNDIETIINEKNAGLIKNSLLALIPRIRDRYLAYSQIELTNRITVSDFTAVEKGVLLKLYNSKTVTSRDIITSVSTIQLLIQTGCCLSCGIGDPDEIDHFLPKEHFPEFSILHKNLIPICGTCNQIKGENIPGNIKDYFHPMFDILPMEPFLSSDITYINNVPKACFSIVPLFNGTIIKAHFDNLNLSTRLEKKARQYFLQIKALKTEINSEYAYKEIERDKIKLGVLIGTHYWKYILCNKMLETNFVDQI